MKKIIFIFVLLYIDSVGASNLYVSKRDIDTQNYVSDCDFLLYDENDVVVDAWIQTDATHEITNIKSGSYKLVERPRIDNSFSNELSVFHNIDVHSNSLEVIFYNSKVATPRNLGMNFNCFIVGCSIIFLGITFMYLGYSKFYYF